MVGKPRKVNPHMKEEEELVGDILHVAIIYSEVPSLNEQLCRAKKILVNCQQSFDGGRPQQHSTAPKLSSACRDANGLLKANVFAGLIRKATRCLQ